MEITNVDVMLLIIALHLVQRDDTSKIGKLANYVVLVYIVLKVLVLELMSMGVV